MVWQRVRSALLVGVLASVGAAPALADDCCAPAPCATRKVCCTEWVPEQYQCTRTVYRTESHQETYTAYRCESVPETRNYTCTVYKRVPEVQNVTRTVCVNVPHVETRTVMEAVVSYKPVTCTVRKCVDRGHYECREVPCESHRLFGGFKKLFHHHDCCDSCEPCCPPPTKTVRVWVPCKVWEECPVTRMERVCEYRPKTCQVTVCRTETRQETCQVTVWKCVPEQQTRTCTVMVSRTVPYQATRTVCRCVPHQETYTATRLVARTVEKEIPCATSCCETLCCKPKCHGLKLGHLLSRLHSSCCD